MNCSIPAHCTIPYYPTTILKRLELQRGIFFLVFLLQPGRSSACSSVIARGLHSTAPKTEAAELNYSLSFFQASIFKISAVV